MKNCRICVLLCAVLSVLSYFSLVSAQDMNSILSESNGDSGAGEIETYDFEFAGYIFEVPAYYTSEDTSVLEDGNKRALSDGNDTNILNFVSNEFNYSDDIFRLLIPELVDNQIIAPILSISETTIVDRKVDIMVSGMPGFLIKMHISDTRSEMHDADAEMYGFYSQKTNQLVCVELILISEQAAGHDYFEDFYRMIDNIRLVGTEMEDAQTAESVTEEPTAEKSLSYETKEVSFGGLTFDIPAIFEVSEEESTDNNLLFNFIYYEHYATLDILFVDYGTTIIEYVDSMQETMKFFEDNFLSTFFSEDSYTIIEDSVIAGRFPAYGYTINMSDYNEFSMDFYYKDGRSFTVTLTSFDGAEMNDFYRELFENLLETVRP